MESTVARTSLDLFLFSCSSVVKWFCSGFRTIGLVGRATPEQRTLRFPETFPNLCNFHAARWGW